MGAISHHLDLDAVLPALERGLANQVRELLDRGFHVTDAWGPVQMGVAGVTLERVGVTVTIDSERGFRVVALEYRGLSTRLIDATLVWARAVHGTDATGLGSCFPASYEREVGLADIDRCFEIRESDRQHLVEVAEWFPEADPDRIAWTKAFIKRRMQWSPSKVGDRAFDNLKRSFERGWRAEFGVRQQP